MFVSARYQLRRVGDVGIDALVEPDRARTDRDLAVVARRGDRPRGSARLTSTGMTTLEPPAEAEPSAGTDGPGPGEVPGRRRRRPGPVWILPAVVVLVVVVMTALGISGSSVASLRAEPGRDGDLIAGEPLALRSDEWNTRTPLVMGQVEDGLTAYLRRGRRRARHDRAVRPAHHRLVDALPAPPLGLRRAPGGQRLRLRVVGASPACSCSASTSLRAGAGDATGAGRASPRWASTARRSSTGGTSRSASRSPATCVRRWRRCWSARCAGGPLAGGAGRWWA